MSKKIFAWILVVLWMGVIYTFSSESGDESSGRSESITRQIQNVIQKTPLKDRITWTEFATRKTAHVTEYFIFVILVLNALVKSGIRGYRLYILAILISIAYAAGDEFHQSFVSDRGPSVRDVLIDGIGVITGAGVRLMIYRK